MIPNYWIIPGIKISTLTLSQRRKLSGVNWTPTLEDIANCVCEYFIIPMDLLKGRTRKAEFVWPRQVFCYLALNLTGRPLTDIGSFIKRDHTTIMHSRRICNNKIETEKISAKEVREVAGMVANINFKDCLDPQKEMNIV